MSRTTILIDKNTRGKLKHIARKDQTYDQLVNELILPANLRAGTQDH